MTRNEEALDIKHTNYRNIYRLFFQYNGLSKPQIVKLLNLSLPTVSNNIGELEAEGKIREGGFFQPQGGRPAIAYQLVENAFISIGVEIQKKNVRCLALNLQGNILAQKDTALYFENEPQYIESLCNIIHTFIRSLGCLYTQILGIGFSIQGIVSKDGQSMLYSRVLPGEHFDVKELQPYFDVPVKLFHDVKCAALTELWFSEQIDNAVYISISEHLGGAIIINNQIDLGKKGYSGALEHLQIHSEGNLCYCGQRGCLETYCSLSALLSPNETIEAFFKALRNKDELVLMRWDAFLEHLAKGLNTVYLLLERDIILGGEIAFYLIPEDLKILQEKILKLSTFPLEGDFIRIATQQKYTSAIGAALPFLIEYLP
ncbi:ROK family transcriptional regulator [[Mannheimia] succiniciproducens]|uniref:NagC protein n=1 Tax=Mannheimia succiniciproducens (strain KCTC 0769BP / MBEL55E) TaxID=221988 RepID=Q65SP0_MANSM|nr:ROK family transcriptional regulator [[Mannheimia] succiniciproducens]AAU38020.1 NagC protein [[Mannheimia] succiniciproducens MBEL55E]